MVSFNIYTIKGTLSAANCITAFLRNVLADIIRSAKYVISWNKEQEQFNDSKIDISSYKLKE